jgi:hypothetical protein
MLPQPHITDHALLRWLERVHGLDIPTWRELMVGELQEALDAYDGTRPADAHAFVLSPTGDKVVTVLAPSHEASFFYRRSVLLARVGQGGSTP